MRYRDGALSVDWIASDADLRSACENLGSPIALDTEFIRTDTYYPVPGLYQIGTTDRVLLIDPQAVTQWEPLNFDRAYISSVNLSSSNVFKHT